MKFGGAAALGATAIERRAIVAAVVVDAARARIAVVHVRTAHRAWIRCVAVAPIGGIRDDALLRKPLAAMDGAVLVTATLRHVARARARAADLTWHAFGIGVVAAAPWLRSGRRVRPAAIDGLGGTLHERDKAGLLHADGEARTRLLRLDMIVVEGADPAGSAAVVASAL
eukprot:CAMPEP_0115828352 /NCGR_PEP_ID=MMETSP0287-20121206/525_1 /TAXON_ID=412157 /ORGANISM="Chrysochromulina rotalis, Strain UIO044" /LENGTH=169 /DNA_ID=CAMNT_0003281557 /DNA_START=308 /DNA_END=812 /DNA_ORIENTATION=+